MHINPGNTSRIRKFRPTRFAALACPKLTFAEPVSYALAQETAPLHSSRTFKAHTVEIKEHTWVNHLFEKIENMQKALEKSTETRKKNDGEVKCFNCRKKCNITRSQQKGHELAPASKCSEISLSQISRNTSNVTVSRRQKAHTDCGYRRITSNNSGSG